MTKTKRKTTVPGTDGVDHINVYSQGATALGRWLSNFAYAPFDLPEHGHFQSVEGYWYWLITRDERLRDLSGFPAKKLGKSLGGNRAEKPAGFPALVLAAIDAKLRANRKMLGMLAVSSLPLAHYYVFDGHPVDAGYKWILDHLEYRRKQLKGAWGIA